VPLKKLTDPDGVPLVVETTVALRVTVAPKAGVRLLAVSVVVVGALDITMEPDPALNVTV
jgi:hypothetical protein